MTRDLFVKTFAFCFLAFSMLQASNVAVADDYTYGACINGQREVTRYKSFDNGGLLGLIVPKTKSVQYESCVSPQQIQQRAYQEPQPVARSVPRPSTNDQKCSDQSEVFAKIITLRKSNASAKFVLDMAIDSDTRYFGSPPSKARADWYKKTILNVYDNPRYLYSDASAEGMKYEDACKDNPQKFLIKD